MPTLLSTLLLSTVLTGAYAQNDLGKMDDAGRIVLTPYVPDQAEGMTDIARNALLDKLGRVATENGMGGSAMDRRFLLAASASGSAGLGGAAKGSAKGSKSSGINGARLFGIY